MATPLPKETAANNALIAATPYAQLTQRQKDYADMYGVTLKPYTPPAALTPRPQVGRPEGGSDMSLNPTIIAGKPGVPLVDQGGTASHDPGVLTTPLPVYDTNPPASAAQNVPAADPAKAAQDAAAQAAAEAKAAQQRDAYVRLQSVLDEYGLGTLSGFIKDVLTQGLSEAEITQRLRDTPEFKARFPAIEERKKKNLPPISPAEYLSYEKQARDLFQRAGLPKGFYDSNDDFTKFLTNNTSVAELADRVGLASTAAFNSDPSVLATLQQFGMTGGDVTAFFLDPDVAQPLLERKYNAARLSAAGAKTGFGGLNETDATMLVQNGVTESQATQGFSDLKYSEELYSPLDGGEDTITRDQQMGATFLGDAASKRRIAQRTRRRQAAFEGGGSFAAGQDGIVGLGVAKS